MNELTITDIIEIVGFLGVFIGGYVKIKIEQAEIKAYHKASIDLQNQKNEQSEKEFVYLKESIQSLKGMVYKQNEDVTRALNENSLAIRELKVTLDYIRTEK